MDPPLPRAISMGDKSILRVLLMLAQKQDGGCGCGVEVPLDRCLALSRGGGMVSPHLSSPDLTSFRITFPLPPLTNHSTHLDHYWPLLRPLLDHYYDPSLEYSGSSYFTTHFASHLLQVLDHWLTTDHWPLGNSFALILPHNWPLICLLHWSTTWPIIDPRSTHPRSIYSPNLSYESSWIIVNHRESSWIIVNHRESS